MIRIISGPFGSGKTGRLAALYAADPQGDGLLFPRILAGERTVGYRVRRLASGEERPFALDRGLIHPDWEACGGFGRFSFSAAGYAFGCAVLDELAASGVSPLWLDEVGPWELEGGGFASRLEVFVSAGADLSLGVRTACVEEVVARFCRGRQKEVVVDAVNKTGMCEEKDDTILSQ